MTNPEGPGRADPAAPITPAEQGRLVPSFSNRGQLEEAERLDLQAARAWALREAVLLRTDLLTEAFARELHRRMFRRVWRGAGRYRTEERTPGWEAKRIPEGMRMFLDDTEGWIRFSTFPVDEAALRLHHRLITLRPWANGNGRHARLLADVVVAAHRERPLTWGAGMVAAGDRYAEAIRAADAGEMEPLLRFARGRGHDQ